MSLEQISSHALLKNDEQLKGIDFEKYSHPVSETVIETTKKALESKNHKVTVVTDKHAALEELKKLIPSGVTVAQAGSTSLVWMIFHINNLCIRLRLVGINGALVLMCIFEICMLNYLRKLTKPKEVKCVDRE